MTEIRSYRVNCEHQNRTQLFASQADALNWIEWGHMCVRWGHTIEAIEATPVWEQRETNAELYQKAHNTLGHARKNLINAMSYAQDAQLHYHGNQLNKALEIIEEFVGQSEADALQAEVDHNHDSGWLANNAAHESGFTYEQEAQ